MTHPSQDDARHPQGNTIRNFTPSPEGGAPSQPRTSAPESSDEAFITLESDDTVPPELSDFLKTVQTEDPESNKGVTRLESREAQSTLTGGGSPGGTPGPTTNKDKKDDNNKDDNKDEDDDKEEEEDKNNNNGTNTAGEDITLIPEEVLAEREVWEQMIQKIINIHNISLDCEWNGFVGVFSHIKGINDKIAQFFQDITRTGQEDFGKIIQSLEKTVRDFEAQDEDEADRMRSVETDSGYEYGGTGGRP